MSLIRDERGVIKHSETTRTLLEDWTDDVILNWTEYWKDRKDHPYSRLATFLGERFLTDFDFRDTESLARR